MKRTISMLLTMAMILSLLAGLSITANAETQIIYDILINNVNQPMAGKTATTEGITIPENANYTLKATWEYYSYEDMCFYDFTGGTFSEGNLYRLCLNVDANEGYRFGREGWGMDCMFWVNGQMYEEASGNSARLYLVYAVGGELFSERIIINGVPEAIPGSPISTEGITGYIPYPFDTNFVVTPQWYVEDEMGSWQEISEGIFQSDKNYRIELTMTVRDTYILGTDILIDIDGWWYDYNWYIRERSASSMTLCPLGPAIPIKTVEINDLPEVKVGEMLPTPELTLPDDAHYSVQSTWYDSNGNITSGPAVNGESYRLAISVIPDRGDGTYKGCYLHWNAVCYLDGEKWDDVELDDMEGLYMNINVPYSLDYEVIDTVALTVSKPTDETSGAVITVPEDANYILYDLEAAVLGAVLNKDSGDAKNEESGGEQMRTIGLKPKEGYVFSDTLAVTVNGKAIDLDPAVSPYGLHITYNFDKLIEVDSPDPTDPTTGEEETETAETTAPTTSEEDKEPAETTDPTTGNKETKPTDPSNPSTGDTFTLITAVALMLSSAMGMGITAAKGKRSAR